MKPIPSVLSESLVDPVDVSADVVVLPVRHHSPACAWHVRRTLESLRPDVVLVEGPADAGPLIDPLLDSKTIPPVAIYCHAVGKSASDLAFFYPFCTYSPEYVALRTGRATGAHVGFLDLPSHWMASVVAEEDTRINLYADGELRHHDYIDELCRATRTRDFDELWDDLFEASGPDLDSQTFFTQVATYCRIAREHRDPTGPARRGDQVRETYMAEAIRSAAQSHRKVVAVVGGLHRTALLDRLGQEPASLQPPAPPKDRHAAYLTIYGYPQLDRWGGYQSGMPAPEFQHWRWQSLEADDDASERWLNALARALKQRREPISTADVIAAGAMLRGLMRFRGHARATLDDLRDAATSAWLKQTDDASRGAIQDTIRRWLVGSRVGKVSASAGRPPLVDDFYRQLRKHRIIRKDDDLTSLGSRTLALDIYRKPAHRSKSAFLHQLVELGSDFARREAGPDFVHGFQTDRMRETWRLRWRPDVEAGLVEASIHGSTMAEAAANRLLDRSRDPHAPRDSATAVGCLTSALLMELPSLADEFLDQVVGAVDSEPLFANAAKALAGLINLVRYRTILGARRFPKVAELVGHAFRRAVWLLDSLPGLAPPTASSEEELPSETSAIRGLVLLRHCAMMTDLEGIDAELFLDRIEAVRPRLGRLPGLEGAALGLLRQFGRVDPDAMAAAIRAAVDNTLVGPGTPLGDFLRGLFALRRHAMTEEPTLLAAIHDCLSALSEERFLQALPNLRLAFTIFTPREVHRLVHRLHQRTESTEGETYRPTSASGIVPAVDARVSKALARLFGSGSMPDIV